MYKRQASISIIYKIGKYKEKRTKDVDTSRPVSYTHLRAALLHRLRRPQHPPYPPSIGIDPVSYTHLHNQEGFDLFRKNTLHGADWSDYCYKCAGCNKKYLGNTEMCIRDSRRSLDRVSVPMWGTFLSAPLLIVALVGRYPANKLIRRDVYKRQASIVSGSTPVF